MYGTMSDCILHSEWQLAGIEIVLLPAKGSCAIDDGLSEMNGLVLDTRQAVHPNRVVRYPEQTGTGCQNAAVPKSGEWSYFSPNKEKRIPDMQMHMSRARIPNKEEHIPNRE
jgi:hypothetical protein